MNIPYEYLSPKEQSRKLTRMLKALGALNRQRYQAECKVRARLIARLAREKTAHEQGAPS